MKLNWKFTYIFLKDRAAPNAVPKINSHWKENITAGAKRLTPHPLLNLPAARNRKRQQLPPFCPWQRCNLVADRLRQNKLSVTTQFGVSIDTPSAEGDSDYCLLNENIWLEHSGFFAHPPEGFFIQLLFFIECLNKCVFRKHKHCFSGI